MMRVPKTIHQVWIGKTSVPERDHRCVQSLKDANPGWEVVLHTEHPELQRIGLWDDIRRLPPSHVTNLLEEIRSRCIPKAIEACLSDVYRIEVLIRNGGVYFDTDVLGLHPIDDVLDEATLAISEEFSANNIGNFFLLATRHHPALYECLQRYREECRNCVVGNREIHPVPVTGPYPTQAVFSKYQDQRILPYEVFSPWNPHYPMPEDYKSVPWPEMSRCVHLFDSKWTSMNVSTIENIDEALKPYWKRKQIT